MAYFRCGGAGIPSSLKSGMDQVLNKKFGTSTTYPPTDWPDTVNLMGMLEEKTVSGAVASFSDGADDVPIKSGTFNVDYTANGVSSMNIIHCGNNMYKGDLYRANYIIRDTGIIDANSNYDVFYLPIKKGVTYTINFVENQSSGASKSIRVSTRDANNNMIEIFEQIYSYGTAIPLTFMATMDFSFALVSLRETTSNVILTMGSTPATFESYTGETETVNFGTSIYGGYYKSDTGILTSTKAADGTDLAEPVEIDIGKTEISSLYGINNIWSDSGDSEIVYRSSGTETIITPTLITKNITENGTYTAAADNADGYSSVTVDVAGLQNLDIQNLIFDYPTNDNNVIYSSRNSSSYSGFKAFVPLLGDPNYWLSNGATDQYVGYKFSTAQIVNYYEIYTRNQGSAYDVSQSPKEWKLQGSNDDGVTWDDLDTVDFSFTASGERWHKSIANTTAYKWYRVYVITAKSTSNDIAIGYINFSHVSVSA